MQGHFAHLRRHPGDNILSALVHAHDDGERLTEDELTSIAMLLLAAGFETTVNLIGNGVALLTAHPEQLALLRAEPHRWPRAVDEVLRVDSPVQRTGRIAQRDTEVAGEQFRANQVVILMLGGANRDPAVFADPDRFDVTRTERRRPPRVLQRRALLPRRRARPDGGRGGAAGAVRPVPRPRPRRPTRAAARRACCAATPRCRCTCPPPPSTPDPTA